MRAEMILRLCQYFHKLPSEILAEDVELLQLMEIYRLANPEEGGPDG
jgi:hypothetical protein